MDVPTSMSGSTFNSIDQLENILSSLDAKKYDVRLDAVQDNYERAKKFHSDNDVVPRLTDRIVKEVNG